MGPRWICLGVFFASLSLLGGCGRRPAPIAFDGWLPPESRPAGDGWRGRDRADLRPDLRRSDGPRKVTCTPGDRMTYVVDDQGRFFRFDPTVSPAITLQGTVSCGLGGHPFSMGVRQDGTAFVLHVNYATCVGLGRVNLPTMTCKPVTALACGALPDQTFGMGYVLNTAGEEVLYIAGTETRSLVIIDPDKGTTTPIGPLPSSGMELTGNSRGELWGFTPEPAAMVYRLDPANGAVLKSFPLNIAVSPVGGRSWAFAAWGAFFYIFYGRDDAGGTSVYRLTADGQLTTFLSKTGLRIVGAGSAVCSGT